MKPIHASYLLVATLAACNSTPEQRAAWRVQQEPQASSALPASTDPASAPSLAQEPEADAPAAPRLSEYELSIWNDPVFRRRLAESYAAEADLEPKLTQPEREQLQAAFNLIATDQVDAAIAALQPLCGPLVGATYEFTLANLYFQQEKVDEALPYYRTAVDKYPKFRRAWKNLAIILVRKAEWKDAAQALTRVVELGGGDAVTYGLLGYAYSNLEVHMSAETAYRMANLLDPQTMDWKMGLARSFFKQKRYTDAAALFGNLIAENTERADLWMLQANAFIGLGQPMRAAENFEVVDRLGKSTPESLNTLGDIYVNEELFEAAVKHYVRALELNPTVKAERAIRAAKALAARGANSQAKPLVARVEELRGKDISAEEKKDLLKLRARIALSEGAGEEEAKVLKEIVDLDPLDGDALLLLGQHAQRSNDPVQAIFYYERAASLESFEPDAKVRHAQLLVSQGKYAEALPLLRRAQQLKPRENIQQYLEQVERAAQAR
jgi:tetratricopeptide (TPR) repeat protein